MAASSAFTPKASLCDAPTNLKEAIDWVLRVTGKDGKELNKETECICGLAAAVTDLLQSVQLDYHGYQGDDKISTKKEDVDKHLNELFSLVQGLGGTAVVRTYIDQLAQVLSALVGWSTIETCKDSNECKGSSGTSGDSNPHGQSGSGDNGCAYLKDKDPENKCATCGCKIVAGKGTPLGRGCTRCSDSDGTAKCTCDTSGGGLAQCNGKECQCALAGKCCKCCCTDCKGCKKDAKCSCVKEEDYGQGYISAYGPTAINHGLMTKIFGMDKSLKWKDLNNSAPKHHQCAQMLLGSVCLIWSGITYMYWTGKWARGSPYWNNHILDGSGLDDGTLSQWLQALGFPKDMLNDAGPGNRLDAVITNEFKEKMLLGFVEPKGSDANDDNGNTARAPFGMNYAGFVHTIHRDSFNESATVFQNGSSEGIDQHKNGAIFKLYILSCAYFTGLQKKTTSQSTTQSTTSNTPKTIREVLYWLSALPYSQGYKGLLDHCNSALEKASPTEKKLSFHQTGRTHPITVHEYNLFAHFQAVTQYCPLVLIGIQGGLHSPKGTDSPALHALYANTECNFTYPAVPIQAYNQVVHYIRALFYQLYFLRKQCAVKVTSGGKWRECRYGKDVLGKDVVSKGVISWMCLGCNPMEHDRNYRVGKVKGVLDGVIKGKSGDVAGKLKELMIMIGEVVVQLGNAQEALEGKKQKAIEGVKEKLQAAKAGLDKAREGLEAVNNGGLKDKLKEAKAKLEELTKSSGALDKLVENGNNPGSLQQITSADADWKKDYSSAKDKISEVIHKVLEVLRVLEKEVSEALRAAKENGHKKTFDDAIEKIKDICNSAKCPTCKDHMNKCGRKGEKKTCETCHQQYMDGFPSPLQAFLEDRLPGFSCNNTMELLDKWEESKAGSTPSSDDYPPAASHLGHCGGSGQCCPLPMGFRGHFHKGSTNDCTGQRLYGILYFFSNENMMQSCVYTLVRVTAALSATTPQVLGDVFGFFRGGVGNPVDGKDSSKKPCDHGKDPRTTTDNSIYFCGWCASGLREEVRKIEWIPKKDDDGGKYRTTVGKALIEIKGDKGGGGAAVPLSDSHSTTSNLSTLTDSNHYVSPLTGELYTAVSATFGGTYLSWVLYLSDALEGGLKSLSDAFQQIECRGCRECDPNKCKKGRHGETGSAQCQCQSIVSCTGVLPVLYRHGFGYGNPFNLEGYQQRDEKSGDYSIDKKKDGEKQCHQFLESLQDVIRKKEEASSKDQDHPLTELLKQVGQLQYDIRLPWIFVLTLAWLVAVLYLALGAIWPLDWTHMRSHWLRGGEHQWQCMWYKVMTGRKGRVVLDAVEYFGRR